MDFWGDYHLSLRDYLKLVAHSEFDENSLPPNIGNQTLQEVLVLCNWPDYFSDWATTKTWIEPKGTVTPLHCDYNDNLFAQVQGRKQFILYPPHVASKLKLKQVDPVLFASEFDPLNPNFDLYTEMEGVQSVRCEVNVGEMLYLPAGWFHHVKAISFSFSVNRWSRDLPAVLMKSAKQVHILSRVASSQGDAWSN
jgi:hypothetical protein